MRLSNNELNVKHGTIREVYENKQNLGQYLNRIKDILEIEYNISFEKIVIDKENDNIFIALHQEHDKEYVVGVAMIHLCKEENEEENKPFLYVLCVDEEHRDIRVGSGLIDCIQVSFPTIFIRKEIIEMNDEYAKKWILKKGFVLNEDTNLYSKTKK